MDRKSIIGLLIIGSILFAFSYFNASNTADKKKAEVSTTDTSSIANNDTETINQPDSAFIAEETVSHLIPKVNSEGLQYTDSLGRPVYTDTLTEKDTVLTDQTVISNTPKKNIANAAEEVTRLENDLLAIDLSNKGGRIINVFLKKFKTYNTYIENGDAPLQLFDRNSTYGIRFFEGDQSKNTANYDFKVTKKSAQSITYEMINPTGKKVGFTYSLKNGTYNVDYDVYFKGFEASDAQQLAFVSDIKLLSTEKHLPSERRIATTFFKYEEDSYDYLSVAGEDDEELEEATDWVAFKQSYFTAIIMNDKGFKPTAESAISIDVNEDDTTYIKQYKSHLNLGVDNINNTIALDWYFGPNDYDLLATYENGSEDIVDLGWGLFRWINVGFIRPIFTWLMSWGIGAGIAILLLTIFVKLLLSPVNYKMYKSSAMMKVLRPEIEKINKKFPKKEDALKKQQETMALYRETGVSPMAGCVPMLIQMPILFAIFRLFPSELALRQKSFLWAEDLSTYDSILQLGFNIPFYGDHVSLFTLLMAGTTLLYTHYNSSNMQQPTMEGMPNMKYIMYFFPIMMIFFFNSYSSGLSYYYFISTLMTIGIMFSIKKFMLDENKIIAKIEANRTKPKKKKGKSRFQQRLEEAQRLQQERQKQKGK